MMGDLEKELIGMRGARQVQGPTQKGRPVQLKGIMPMIMIFQFKIMIILHVHKVLNTSPHLDTIQSIPNPIHL